MPSKDLATGHPTSEARRKGSDALAPVLGVELRLIPVLSHQRPGPTLSLQSL